MQKSLKKTMVLILMINILGLFFSYVLTREHYLAPTAKHAIAKYNIFDLVSQSICGGKNSYFNCGKIASSKYAMIKN